MREIVIENQWLRAVILPEVGAKIYDLLWKPAARRLLWRNRRVEPQVYPVEGIFDNYWCGGWDDCFPTCDPCTHGGEQYPGLGELRSLRWTVDRAESRRAMLSIFGPISPVRVEKSVVLDADAPALRMRHTITNIGHRPIDFLWGTHPALNVSVGDRLRIPARKALVGEASTPAFGTAGSEYDWPLLPDGTDMSLVPAATGEFCGHYATELEGGWYAVETPSAGSGFLLRFPLETCPVLWLWLNYGGYRGHYHVVAEPWTSRPVNLAEAVRLGTARRLEVAATFEVEVAATAYDAPETWRDALKRTEGKIKW